jgi:hypothetical protein
MSDDAPTVDVAGYSLDREKIQVDREKIQVERGKLQVERDKYRVDIAKHFTTLISGAIVVLPVVRQFTPPTPDNAKIWLVSYVLLFPALLICAMTLITAWGYSYDDKSWLPKQSSRDLLVLGAALYCGALAGTACSLILR